MSDPNDSIRRLSKFLAKQADAALGSTASTLSAEATREATRTAGAVTTALTAHTGRTDNPHGVTAAQVGAIATSTLTTQGDLLYQGPVIITRLGIGSAGQFLRVAGGLPSWATLGASDIPTLNQNTTGTAANVSGTVAIANGGTGATTAGAALTALGAQPLDADLTAIAALTANGLLRKSAGTWGMDAATYLTGNQTITATGDVTGTGTTALTLTLASVGTAGTYRSVTVDAKGRVTAGTNPTTLAGYGITDAAPLSHTTNTSNPHSVTAAQVGAIATSTLTTQGD
ncbi:MAG: hypothetical protein WCG26_06460, partial [Chloroflexales bacterium]